MTSETARYFDANARGEWERMDANMYMRLIWLLHMDFIADCVRPGVRVLDAGGGSGRYTAELLKAGCDVTLLDISSGELAFARERLSGMGLNARAYVCADIRDMSMLKGGEYDLTLCYGAPLDYCMQGRDRALSELRRVTRPGGTVALSVNNLWGILHDQMHAGARSFFHDPEYWKVWDVVSTGDCPRFEEIGQPERHFFTAPELERLMRASGLEQIELGAAPCLSSGARRDFDALCADQRAWDAIRRLELTSYRDRALIGMGEFLLARGRVA